MSIIIRAVKKVWKNSVKRLQHHTRHVSNYLKFFALRIRFIEKFNGSQRKFCRLETHL